MTNEPITAEQEIELMKLAAGELSPEQETDLLLTCEREPTLWRAMALSMLEERHLATALAVEAELQLPESVRWWNVQMRQLRGSWMQLAVAAMAALVCGAGMMQFWQDRTGSVELREPSQVVIAEGTASSPPAQFVGAEQDRNDFDAQALRPLFSPLEREVLRQYGYDVIEEGMVQVIENRWGENLLVPQQQISFVRLDH